MCVLDSRRCPRAKKASVRVAEAFAPERTFSMREVLEAGDPLPAARLPTRVARRRAERYLANVDRYF